ncbi:DNA helicase [Shewanella phage Thanatos-1]|nr:DNA helicase [Shewanella phage Thanatos-1]
MQVEKELTYNDLTEGQKMAFDTVMAAVKQTSTISQERYHVTINGQAGTGKTTLTKFIVREIIAQGINGVILAAPTHAAKKTLMKLSGMEAATIHSVLGISPNNYEDQMLFEQNDVPDLANCRVLICDEGSMYDDKLVNLVMSSIPPWCVVIVLGDKEQIRPVAPGESIPRKSPFFSHAKFKQITLTEVKRSDGPILEVARNILNNGWLYENIKTDEEGNQHGVFTFNPEKDSSSVQWFFKEYFKRVKTPEDFKKVRCFAFTNKMVDSLNKIIRKTIYKTEEPFIVGEELVMQGPVQEETIAPNGQRLKKIVFSNGQYVKVLSVRSTVDSLTAPYVDSQVDINVWVLEIESADPEDPYENRVIRVIDIDSIPLYNEFLSLVAYTYKNWNRIGKAPWKAFWSTKTKYSSVKPEAVCTIHKSQGLTCDTAFLCTSGMSNLDSDIIKELVYVGSTRPKHNLYWI